MQDTKVMNKGWITAYLKSYGWYFAGAAMLGTLAVLCAAALLYTSGYLISRSALRPENVLMVYVPIVLVRAFGFGKAIFQYVERLVGHHASLRVLAAMRARMYRLLEPQALRLRSRFRSGDLLGLLAEDIEQLQNVYLRIVLPAISALFVYAVAITLLGRMDTLFACYMALYGGFWLFIAPAAALWISSSKRRRFQQVKKNSYQELTDAIFGMGDWILSGRTKKWLEQFQEQQATAAQLEKKLRRSEWRIQWLSRCATAGAVVMLVVWAGRLAAQGRIDATWIAALGLVAFPLMEAILRVVEAIIRMPDYQDSLERLNQIGDAGTDSTHLTSLQSLEKEQEQVASDSIDLKLESVSFHYPNERECTVKDISLHIPQGSKIAVLGRSGAGKTTLLHLILGELHPKTGKVTINALPVHEGMGVFSVLNQRPYLFDTTVANNIRLGRSEATQEEIRSVAEQVGLHEMIESLSGGYETRMEETGRRFSGGERQRIALARVLLQNHPVVVLDEPTAGLDPITEAKLLETIFRVLKGKSIIWVTHHLLGIEQMDELLFMEKGSITMRGTHEELLRLHEKYRRLYELDQI
ncbi:thiol reductant ABC exporter subunit CydC [Paenibacillus agricola]|uniref:Thiol reductant ABC exporter subunit CydC n=1 Tax=Paenibacillus agricola TaxID=2716264 RepID=A0ABX0IY48_9BACL|nr:thiol reductant ABC exporter subunit CydC [Paenibacillus agricola]NHN28874.1 thiol reductant ABC exporter subunit CydC [Paenibacillus agricola]